MRKYFTSVLVLFSLGFYSCEDYLTLEPLNEIVLENFWLEKSDVESVVASCYYNMCSSSLLNKLFVWGEMRSDNIVAGKAIGLEEDYIMNANILPESSYAPWKELYNVINLCNTVIYYAPGVQEKDQNFTNSDLDCYLAEMLTLRSLCYFYLIRTFYEVPLVLDATIGDDVDFKVAATPTATIIEQLISDLLKAENYSRSIYTSVLYNKGRITTQAVQALLADIYLWKGDYHNCAIYCQKVIDDKIAKYEKSSYEYDYVSLFKGYPLISSNYSDIESFAYYSIFGIGNSFESIFELQFNETSGVSNNIASTYFGTSSDINGPLAAASKLGEASSLYRIGDCRRRENTMPINEGGYPICKYAVISHYTDATGDVYSHRSDKYANWIFYRLSDVMLMKAEALSLENGDDEASLHEAFNLVSAVYNRSNPGIGQDTLVYTDYNSSDKMEGLVFTERQRELSFEGKRWFDLVRMSLRDGKNDRMLNLVIPKYTSNQEAIRSKMTSPYALYFPISASELKVNDLLKQNPIYDTAGGTTNRK